MGAKHNKCCCTAGTCLIGSDNFDRVDNDDPGPLWNEISGDFDIVGNQLHTISAGLLITKLRQAAPVDSANYSYQFSFRHIAGGAPPKIVCKFTDSNNFDWIELFDVGSSQYKPKFWRRSGGSDSLLVDPASYSIGGFWDLSGDLVFTICYSSLEWSISGSVGSFNWSFCLGVPATSLPASPNGLVGFMDGDYDDFTYFIHHESQNDCPQCSCFCWDGVDGKCIPETLYLTLTPVVDHTDCTSSPATHVYTMRQSLPTEPVTPPPVYQAYPQKQYWFSDPVEIMEPVNDPHPLWFRLECLGNGEFELLCLEYPSGAQTAPATLSAVVIQFTDLSGTNGGSPAITVDCSPIILTFSNFLKSLLQIGSGGPYTCTPYDAIEYTTVITE